MARPSMLLAVGVLAAAAVACAPADTPPSGATLSPTASTACTKDQLKLVNAGKLTIATDKPAFEPWFKDDDPSNGQGFESAVAFAVAGELGFDHSEVQWSTVKFDSAFAPGAKQFDFDINEVSITPDRAKAVDFSHGYYTVKQAIVAMEDQVRRREEPGRAQGRQDRRTGRHDLPQRGQGGHQARCRAQRLHRSDRRHQRAEEQAGRRGRRGPAHRPST